MPSRELLSAKIPVEDSIESINELFYEKGMTDGHPIIPPTPERVEAMLSAVDLDPQTEVGILGPKFGVATVEKIAINAVMAWCKPEYMPALIAAVEAMAQPEFNLYGLQATTHPSGTPVLIINGPIRKALGVNCGSGCFGHGTRANATIGRAVRLILTNVGGAYPGRTDMSTQGWAGKYGFCFGENEEQSPWEPLHVERGFDRDASTVTVVGTGASHNYSDLWSTTPEEVLTLAAQALSAVTSNLSQGGEPLLALCPEHAEISASKGFSKADVKDFLFEHSGMPFSTFAPVFQEWKLKADPSLTPDTILRPAQKPEDIMIVVAGGAGPQSVFIPTFGDKTCSVTREIRTKS